MLTFNLKESCKVLQEANFGEYLRIFHSNTVGLNNAMAPYRFKENNYFSLLVTVN